MTLPQCLSTCCATHGTRNAAVYDSFMDFNRFASAIRDATVPLRLGKVINDVETRCCGILLLDHLSNL